MKTSLAAALGDKAYYYVIAAQRRRLPLVLASLRRDLAIPLLWYLLIVELVHADAVNKDLAPPRLLALFGPSKV